MQARVWRVVHIFIHKVTHNGWGQASRAGKHPVRGGALPLRQSGTRPISPNCLRRGATNGFTIDSFDGEGWLPAMSPVKLDP